MKETYSRFREGLMNTLEVPEDLASQESLLTITGSSSLYIENYKSIQFYSQNSIRILTRKGRIRICGKSLKIQYYTSDEMGISGNFQEIVFES